MDTNREAGTVSTGDYGRGDSAALFVASKSLMGGSNLAEKETMAGVVRKALSQKVCAATREHGRTEPCDPKSGGQIQQQAWFTGCHEPFYLSNVSRITEARVPSAGFAGCKQLVVNGG